MKTSIVKGVQNVYLFILAQVFGAIKGITGSIFLQAALPLFFFHDALSTSTYQAYSAIVEIPWCLQGLIAAISFTFPIYNKSKQYYAYIGIAMVIAATLLLIATSHATHITHIITFVIAAIGFVTVNTLYTGSAAELVAFYNADKKLLSIITAFSLVGSIGGAVVVGAAHTNLTVVFAVAAAATIQAAIAVIYVGEKGFPHDIVITAENYSLVEPLMKNTVVPPKHANVAKHHNLSPAAAAAAAAPLPQSTKQQWVAVIWITIAAMFLMLTLATQATTLIVAFTPFIIAVSIAALTDIFGKHNNVTAKFATFIFIHEIICIDIDPFLGAYYTANDTCVINGTNFSLFFYITVVSIGVAISGIAASAYMTVNNINTRSIIQLAFIAKIAAVIPDIIIIKKWAPKSWFKLIFFFDNAVIVPFASTIIFIAEVFLITAIINKKEGKASITYNIIVSFAVLGKILAKALGLFIAHDLLNIGGSRAAGCNFDNILPLIIIANGIFPILAIALAYIAVPNIALTN